MFRGKLTIGDVEMECHVLNDFRRVLTQREMVRVLSPAGRESGNLAGYFQSKAFADKPLDLGAVIPFRVPGTQYVAHGYEATTLIEICERYLEARDEGLLRGGQKKLAVQAEIVIRSCAKVGIIALIDEATGYDKFKTKQEYQLKLQAFIADELQEWARMFPDDFWFELARLENIHYSPRARPLRWGKYVMMFVYDAIDEDIGKELRKKNPDPHYLQNHHQWLKKFGRDKVHDQITKVVTIMKLCENIDEFRQKFSKLFNRTTQMEFTFAGSVVSLTIRAAAWLTSSRLHLCSSNWSRTSPWESVNCMLQYSQMPSCGDSRTILSFRFAMPQVYAVRAGVQSV